MSVIGFWNFGCDGVSHDGENGEKFIYYFPKKLVTPLLYDTLKNCMRKRILSMGEKKIKFSCLFTKDSLSCAF